MWRYTLTVLLQCCNSVVTVVLQWCYSVVAVLLQCCYNGDLDLLRLTIDAANVEVHYYSVVRV
jgi:hypothetical protein